MRAMLPEFRNNAAGEPQGKYTERAIQRTAEK
jgi:hypothetical protein